MSFFLFVLDIFLVLEIFLVVVGIALALPWSELRVSRTRVIHDERKQEDPPRS